MTLRLHWLLAGFLGLVMISATAQAGRVYGTFSAVVTGEQDQFSYFFDGGQYGGGGGNHQFIPTNTYTLTGAFDYESDMSVWANSPGGHAHTINSSFGNIAVSTNGGSGLLNVSLTLNGHTYVMTDPQTSQSLSFSPNAGPSQLANISMVIGKSTGSIFDHFQFTVYTPPPAWFVESAGIAQTVALGPEIQAVSIDGFGHPANFGYFQAWLGDNAQFQTTINFTMNGLTLDGGAGPSSLPEPVGSLCLLLGLGFAGLARHRTAGWRRTGRRAGEA